MGGMGGRTSAARAVYIVDVNAIAS